MSLDTPADRLRWARKHHGQYQTATEAARAFGWPVSTYLGHENGDRNPSRDAAKRYARAYHVRWEWLLENEGPPVDAPGFDIVTVPVLSWEGAADLLNEQAHIPVENVPLMAFAQLGRGRFFALRVGGDSMDRISPDGSVIVVNRDERELVPGKPYLFWYRGVGVTYKMWQPEPRRLEPFSWNAANRPIFIRRKSDYAVIGRVRRTVLDL